MEHLSNDLGPAVEEINPAVLHVQRALLRLGPGLVQEYQLAAVVEVPGETVLRESGRAGFVVDCWVREATLPAPVAV